MKCANCKSDALYAYHITKAQTLHYCGKHLPSFLFARRDAGQLAITEAMTVEIESALAAVATRQEEAVVVPKKTRKKTAQ
jgi:hypothetical protein